ncbi:hypothetical protein [Xanthomonas campestris]|uniref:hypothetical protein n=1 Tax=Xanthomonas campestris TaxID=339 RepID=UPI002B23752E|nr:hypothetical protein [Xanthomonas campestris]MEA9731846.1 hypothetical protein [Xanthomonas campestris]
MVESLTLRRPEFLSPAEIKVAISRVISDNLGARPDELVLIVSRQLGYRSTSTQLRQLILDQIEALRLAGRLADKGELVVLA